MRYRSTLTALDRYDDLKPGQEVNEWLLNTNDTLEVVCRPLEQYCDTNILIIYPQLNNRNYLIEIDFDVDPTLNSLVDGMLFGGRTQNPKFTSFLIIFRYVLLGLSFLALLVYMVFYCRVPLSQITFEHKAILLLSFSLFLFNDPIFALTIFKPTIGAAAVSTIFVMQFIGFLVWFWVAMWRRMHRETVNRTTNQADWIAWGLGFLVFGMLTVACAAGAVYTRLDPGVHIYARRPIVYSVFLYLTVALCVLLIIGLFFHSFKIYERWNQVIPRHRFFFQWSLMMVVIMFAILASGMYQSYDMNGVQLMILFLVCNFYIIALQLLWRFSGSDSTGGDAYPREGSFERAKETLGLNYFDRDTDVEFSRSHSGGKSDPNDDSDGEKEAGRAADRPYIEFDVEPGRNGDGQRAISVFGETNDRVILNDRNNVSANLNDTDHMDGETGELGQVKTALKGPVFSKDA